MTEFETAAIVAQIIANHPDYWRQAKLRPRALASWFYGRVMYETRGKADISVASRLVDERLKREAV